MEIAQPIAPHNTVGQLRKRYGQSFAEGYEDTDPITFVLGRAGVATLGEYLQLHRPVVPLAVSSNLGPTNKAHQSADFPHNPPVPARLNGAGTHQVV